MGVLPSDSTSMLTDASKLKYAIIDLLNSSSHGMGIDTIQS